MPSAESYEEARWSRVLTQQAVAFSAFGATLILTRLWTSFTSTKFLRRRHKNRVDTALALTDIVCSTASMCVFVAQSVIREYDPLLTAVEVLLSLFYTAAAVRRLWLKNFDFAVAFTFSTFFDVYATSVVCHQLFSGQPTWLTPTFMRSLSVLIRYEEVMKMGLFSSYAGEVKQRLGLAMLRFACVTFFYACVGFCLEILGDIDYETDGSGAITRIFESNPNYDTTVLTQLYFVVVTLSTVGYGDFTPSTTLHQVFAIAMIVSGVAFFSSEVSAIVALKDEIDSGRGQYRRSRFRNAHIIVLGGAVTSGSATLQIFLEELLHPSRPNSSLPDVVLMSEEEPGTGLRRVLMSPLGQAYVKFIRGSPMDQADLARADAANADMAFVLGNLSVQDHLTEAEDEDTILRASLLQRQLPGLPVRLLLLRSWAKEMARTAGINPLSCLTAGVLNHCRTALAVRCPGLPVLLTTMYSKLAGDWSQLPSSMMPWVREYFTSMRHDVYGAQIGAAFDGMPFLEAAARIYRVHDVNLLAVQSSPENGGRLCPAGMIGGHLHVLSEGDVVMCLGQDVKRVLRAVDSSSKHPEAWRARFHAVRTAAARMGVRREVFAAGPASLAGASIHGGSMRGSSAFLNMLHNSSQTGSGRFGAPSHRRVGSGNVFGGGAPNKDLQPPAALSAEARRLSAVDSDDERSLDVSFRFGVSRSPSGSMAQKRRASVPAGVAAGTPDGSSTDLAALGRDAERAAAEARGNDAGVEAPRDAASSASTPMLDGSGARDATERDGDKDSSSNGRPSFDARGDASARYADAQQATWRRGDALGMRAELAELAMSGERRRRLIPSALAGNRLSQQTRNLSTLRAKLATKVEVQHMAKAVRKQRAEGLAELGFTSWRSIARIAKTGGHIVVIVDGELDKSRWNELEVLLYRLRGNDGSNIRPIIVLSRSPPAVQDLILWRSIEVYVTEGCVSDVQTAQTLGFDHAANIVLLADACASDNPLLMDRRVLLATSVLEREDELTPDHMLPKVVLEFHHPKSVWHVQEARGFGSLESGLRKHMCRSDGSNGTRTCKVDHDPNGMGMSRRGSSEHLAALAATHSVSHFRSDRDLSRRRFSTDTVGVTRGRSAWAMHAVRANAAADASRRPSVTALFRAPFARSLSASAEKARGVDAKSDVRAFRARSAVARDARRGSLDRGWGSMASPGLNTETGGALERSRTPLGLAVAKSRENTLFAKFLRGCLKFVGVLDREGRQVFRGSDGNSSAYRDSFQNQSRLSWVEHPESHTQYSRGNVMFRTEVSRVMATVFYTPGLMELVDSLTRDAHSGEDVGHHPRIWSVPLPEDLKGKRMGDAFEKFSKNEALVVGVYRNVRGGKARRRVAEGRNVRRGSVDATLGAEESPRSRSAREGASSPDGCDKDGDARSSDSDADSDSNSEMIGGRRRADPEHDYVLTAPPHTVRLNPTDRLYVIATTDWAWVNVPEMIELRKTSAVICLQRQFRARADRRKEEQRDEKLAEFAGRVRTREDGRSLSQITFRRGAGESRESGGQSRAASPGIVPPLSPRR